MAPADPAPPPAAARAVGARGVLRNADVEASPLDARKFRVITLANQIRVLLVRDPETDMAAAALDVSVGHFSDPWGLPGVAHFCEHMLFLGTEKYPDEGSYRQFLAENSGYSNAYTSLENTNYHFQLLVPPNDLDAAAAHGRVPRFREALDRFSQFFKTPLFTESATERELNAVDSEHQKNIQRDLFRLYQLQKTRSNPAHPYSKFATGSKATLGADAVAAGLDTRQALLDFHKKYYSANLMNLCVVAPYDLDVLEEWIAEFFSGVENKNAPHPRLEYANLAPLLPQHEGRITLVHPIKEMRRLDLTWLIPCPDSAYKSKPGFYLSHLLGHEGKGSFLSLIKSKGWADTLAAAPHNEINEYAFMRMQIDLTAEGIEHVDEVVHLLFGFLQLIRESGVVEWVYEEIAAIARLNFHFQESPQPYTFAQNITALMPKYPPERYMTGPSMPQVFDPEAIHGILKLLTPERCNITIISRFATCKTPLRERWYDTCFGEEPIPKEKLLKWSNAKPHPDLAIPPKNIFIPTNFDMLAEPLPHGERDWSGPSLVEKNEHYTLYYKLDRMYNRPRVTVYMEMCTSMAYMSPRHTMLTKLFAKLLIDELNEYSYDAEVAGIHFNLLNTHTGLRLIACGYNDKLGVIFRTIIEHISKFRTTPERFAILLDWAQRENRNFAKDQPFNHAMYATSHLMEQPRWHIDEYLAALTSGDITADSLNEFVPKLLSRLHIVTLIAGNVTEQWSRDLMRTTVDTLGYRAHPASELPVRRVARLPLGVDVVRRQQHPNAGDNNSAIKVMFEVGLRGDFLRDVAVELLGEILNKPCFHELRTVQQLGYMVFQGTMRYESVRALYIIVQSPVADPDELLRRIRKFLVDVRAGMLAALTDAEFGAYVSSLGVLKLEKEKKMFEQMTVLWSEIHDGEFVFDRQRREADALKKVTKEDVLAVFDDCIAQSGARRRCLVSMVYGNQHPLPPGGKCPPSDEKNTPPVVLVTDLTAFRNSVDLYPGTGPTHTKVALGGAAR